MPLNIDILLPTQAITFVSDETDAKILNEVQDRFEVDITELPDQIDLSTYIEGRWTHHQTNHLYASCIQVENIPRDMAAFSPCHHHHQPISVYILTQESLGQKPSLKNIMVYCHE